MKIGVEASCLARKARTGVDVYSYNLLINMIKRAPEDFFELAYFQFVTKPDIDLGVHAPNVRQRRVTLIPGRGYSALFKYAWAPPIDLLSGARGDVYLFPNFGRWGLAFTDKSVVVIHDLAYLNAPEYVPERLRKYLNKYVPLALKQASAIIAVSETTKRDIVKSYGYPSAKITVASNAVDHDEYKPASDDAIEAVRAEYGITKPYIHFHGTIEPRKNVQGVVNAYAQLPEEVRQKYALVLSGGKGWLDDEIHDRIRQLQEAGETIIQTGYLKQAHLPALYSGASVFVYPSFYEGLGLPVIEAMACGAPVITSNVSSLPEAAGDAGLLVDPTSIDDLSAAMEKVLVKPGVAEGMRRRGFLHARKFNWADSAAAALKLMHRVAGK
jgi:glycosyltransferase involved in cell wall biosynthesis